jgi:hypothetical protein
MVDFFGLASTSNMKKPLDPEEIFRMLPKRDTDINDLWRGQTDALRLWNKDHRSNRDTLIALNTGAGKTLVGLLMAQSLMNELHGNVLYVCATIDLVKQTAKQANALGMRFTTRIEGGFSDDGYEIGEAFCITTYQAVFQPFSVFKNDRQPKAVIFDDAHVAEPTLRSLYSLTLSHRSNPVAFGKLASLLESFFDACGLKQTFKDVQIGTSKHILMCPLDSVCQNSEQLAEAVRQFDPANSNELKYSWALLKDHLKFCCITFAHGRVEISPPFLPTLSQPIMSRTDVRRIYLSATLDAKSDFSRSFGTNPSLVAPAKNDAGQGERLIVFSDMFTGSTVPKEFTKRLSLTQRVVVAVPSYAEAEKWQNFATPPKREEFSAALDAFRDKATNGIFLLVQRVDGIDLPKDTCRLMVIDGLPVGESLLERYQAEQLNLRGIHSSRLATRVTQLFGRINRGQNDYGVFLVSGRDANNWLKRDQNVALLPALLQSQIMLGRTVTDQIVNSLGSKKDGPIPTERSSRAVEETVSKVLSRDNNSGWTQFYNSFINSEDVDAHIQRRAAARELALRTAGQTEVQFQTELWFNRVTQARTILEASEERVAVADERLGGWFSAWIGVCHLQEGNLEEAELAFQKSVGRLPMLPITMKLNAGNSTDAGYQNNPVFRGSVRLLTNRSDRQFKKLIQELSQKGAELSSATDTPFVHEEAVRRAGELLGFSASRPDNDGEGGPDVLWAAHEAKFIIPFELKTGKTGIHSMYNASEIGKTIQHQKTLKERYPEYSIKGITILGPDLPVSDTANPGDDLFLLFPNQLETFLQQIIALLNDLRPRTELQQIADLKRFIVSKNLNDAGIQDWAAQRLLSKQPKEKGH